MNKFKAVFLSLLTPLVLVGAVSHPAAAFDLFGDACSSSEAKNSPACQQAANEGGANNRVTGPRNIINTAANILALITGVAAVIMIIISGFRFVTAGGATPGQRSGDPNAVKSARQTLVASIIGLVVVALAWIIVRFATDKLIQ